MDSRIAGERQRAAGNRAEGQPARRDWTDEFDGPGREERSEDRFRLLVGALPVIVMEMRPDGSVSYANEAASDFFGFAAAGLNRKGVRPRFCVRHLDVIRDGFAAMSPAEPVTRLATRLERDGQAHWIEWNLRGTFGEDGHARRYLTVGFDITVRKSHEERLQESREIAQAANQAKSEFLANMSHEIRTPLNGVQGMLQLMETTPLNREQREYVRAAMQSSERLTHLLSDILDLSRVESGKLTLNSAPFVFREAVESVSSLFELAARQAGLDISCQVDPSIPEVVVGDKMRILQVLNNLVGNALKFTRQGGVSIEACRQRSPGNGEFRVLFVISDTGIGIPDDHIASLCCPFTQVSAGYNRRFEGAGLGLTICKRLVDLMGGNITIDSEEGGGTTIAVSVPLEPAQPRTSGDSAPATGLRVLVAEDDYVNAYAVRAMLEQSGCRVRMAGSGGEVLKLLGQDTFDIVLMDIQMPGMNGVDAAKAIRRGEAGGRNASVPIVAITAFAMADDQDLILRSGMNGHVAKPFNRATLLDAMAEAITCARR